MMRQQMKKISILVAVMALMFAMAIPASAAVKLNKKKATLFVGETLKLKVKGAAKVKWSSSAKKVAKVSSKGKVTALKPGKAKITAKVGNKKFVCKITVKARPDTSQQTSTETAGNPTSVPQTEKPEVTSTPSTPVTQPQKPEETTAKPSSQPSVTPPKKTSGTVSDLSQLNEVLRKREWKTVTLQTSSSVKIGIPDGDYSDVELIINMPNGSVENNGRFKKIRIQAIAENTYTENASSNEILYEASKGRCLVGQDAKASITITDGSGETSRHQLTLVNNSLNNEGCKLTLLSPTDLVIDGAGISMDVNVLSGAAGSTIDTSDPLHLEAMAPVTLNLRDGAENTSVSLSDDQNTPQVTGIGSVTIENTSTGVTYDKLAVNTGIGESSDTVETVGTLKAGQIPDGLTDAKAWLLPYTGVLDDDFTMTDLDQALEAAYDSPKSAQSRTFSFSNVPYGNYTLVVKAENSTVGIHNFTVSSASVLKNEVYSDGIHNEDLASMAMSPLMGEGGVFAVADVEGDNIIDYSFRMESGTGFLDLIGTTDTLPDFSVIFKDDHVERHVIGRNDEAWQVCSEQLGETPAAFVRAESGIYSCVFCVTYTNDYKPEDLLHIQDVTGDQIYGWDYQYDWVENGSSHETIQPVCIYTDTVDDYPDTEIQTPRGVSCVFEKEEHTFGNRITYTHKAVLSIGEKDTASYHEKTIYIRYAYQHKDGSNDLNDLFDIASISCGSGGDIDGFELEDDGYGSEIYIYFDEEKDGTDVPADLTATLTDGGVCVIEPDTVPTGAGFSYATLTRGIWSIRSNIYWCDSFTLRGMTIDDTALQNTCINRDAPNYKNPSVDLETDAWDDYPDLAFDTAPGVTYEDDDLSWEKYQNKNGSYYDGSLTISNGKRTVTYGIDLTYRNGTETVDKKIRITNVTGDQIDGFEEKDQSLFLYCDVEADEHPTTFAVTLQDGTTKIVTTRTDDYGTDWVTVTSGIWSKEYSVSCLDCFSLTSVTSDGESNNITPQTDSYHIYTANWDKYPVVVATPKVKSVTSNVYWFGEENTPQEALVGLPEDKVDLYRGVIVLSNARGHEKKIWLSLTYYDNDIWLHNIGVSELSGTGVDAWRWDPGTGLHIYYDQVYGELPQVVTVKLTKGDSVEATIKPGEVYSDWQYGTMDVHSGIWTRVLDIVYEDSFKISSSDIHLEGSDLQCQLYKESKEIYIPTASWDACPVNAFSVMTHGITSSITWTAGTNGNEIYSSGKGGELKLTNGTRTETYDLHLQFQVDESEWTQKIGVKSISAPEITDTMDTSSYGSSTLFTLYSRAGALPTSLQVTKTDDQVINAALKYEENDGYRQYYMDVTEGIWKQKYYLSFRIASMEAAWKINDVQGTGLTGYSVTYDGESGRSNCYLYIYGTYPDVPDDLEITFANDVNLTMREGVNDWGTLTLNDCFTASLAIISSAGDPPVVSEPVGEASPTLGTSESWDDSIILSLPEEGENSSVSVLSEAEEEVEEKVSSGLSEEENLLTEDTSFDEEGLFSGGEEDNFDIENDGGNYDDIGYNDDGSYYDDCGNNDDSILIDDVFAC